MIEALSCRGRPICPGWRMVPALLSLAACITGIVVSLLYKNPYLTIPFGIGAFCASYGVYLGIQFKDLQSLQKSTSQLCKENQKLEEGNQTLKTQVGHLQSEISKLENLNNEINDFLNRLKETLEAARFDHLEEMQTERSELNNVRNAIQQIVNAIDLDQYKKAVDRLARVQAEMQAIEALLPELRKLKEEYQQLLETTKVALNKLFEQLGERASEFTGIRVAFEEILQRFQK